MGANPLSPPLLDHSLTIGILEQQIFFYYRRGGMGGRIFLNHYSTDHVHSHLLNSGAMCSPLCMLISLHTHAQIKMTEQPIYITLFRTASDGKLGRAWEQG